MTKRILVGISGASGAGYFVELIKALDSISGRSDIEVTVIHNDIADKIIKDEEGMDFDEIIGKVARAIHHSKMDSAIASGSNPFDEMVICPCSTSTVGKIHSGISDNLLTRCASVALKERRPLILVIRETPLSTPTLKAMFELSAWGVTIMPASPAFYGMKDPSGNDLHRNFAGRVLDILGLENELTRRYDPAN